MVGIPLPTRGTQTLFQSGWFVVGLLSQTLVGGHRHVHVYSELCIVAVNGSSQPVIVMIVGIALPFSPLASYLQLQALPLSYFRGWLRFWQGI